METFISDFNWLWTYFVIIGAAFAILGVWKLIDEIRLYTERRRYRRARAERTGATWAKKSTGEISAGSLRSSGDR
ncbi:hypothetical protein SEA_FIDGETORCA_74 [Streptomyces phage FidgetOrca]|uniref:Heme exporter protein D n=1 Tax=Streptomyces phage FidgetOrca TaxID=2656619 RepID=A0A649VYV4_9CAUD|nr:hypothetical protein SEA_FIDGETORCA_74 [Streptomyces phage FidgetOrca]